MSAPEQRAARRARSLRLFAAAGVLALGLVLASAFAGLTIQENALERHIADLDTQIAAEQARGATLLASAAEKRTTDYVIEKAKQLGWVWPWEALIAVQRDASARAQALPQSERPSRIERWLALFVGSR